ncbi:MAG: alpha/beta fold hydrolase, partial [Anaerolineae bacterium]|nr:alpha/beta fold hydrolase [Anaerolineae bacterium]
MTDLDPLIEHHLIKTNGITLHVVTAGPADGQPVVLLHGFPEFWYGWKEQIPALAAAGYRVIVPDQRGYNQSDKPKGVEQYTLDKLTGDIAGLLDALGYADAYIVGHDWGA